MILTRLLVLAVCVGLTATIRAQTPAVTSDTTTAAEFGGDERAARLANRYHALLLANPLEGTALDRLWKAWEDHGAAAALVERCRADADRTRGMAAWLVYGHVLRRAGRPDEAASAYSRAGEADPASSLPLVARADLAAEQRQPEAAASLYAAAVSRLPAQDRLRPDLLMKLGNAWLAAGDPGKAAESWEQIVAADPANLPLRKRLAETYSRHHLTEQALAQYEYLDQHADSPTRGVALREIARLHEGRGEFDAARDALERGLELTSRDNWLHGEFQGALIRLYQRANREPELEARWRQAADRNPRDLGACLRLEALAESRGDPAQEKVWLTKITLLAPRDRDSRLKLARLLGSLGERDAAAASYDQLLKEQPGQVEWTLARADLDLQAGQPEAGVARLEALLAHRPADETVGTPILDFFLAHHLDEPAERLLRAAAERSPAAVEPGVALAKFFFARRRAAEGRRVLDALGNQPGTPRDQAARWQRLAATYRDENLPGDALRCLEEARKLAPTDTEPMLAESELLLAGGDAPSAVATLRRAFDAAPEGSAREEIDRKLYQATALVPNGKADPAAPKPTLLSSRRTGLAAAVPGGALGRFLGELADGAAREPSASRWRRLARWQAWSRLPGEAAASAGEALKIDPDDLPARRLLVTLATASRQYHDAEQGLRELIGQDPAGSAAYQQQLAALLMDEGNFDAALAIYRERQAAQPGAAAPLTELAFAQQRAGQWFDALASWKLAIALHPLTPAQHADILRSLVAAYEHLGEYRPAADALLAAVDEQIDSARKQDSFHELSDFCERHDLLAWLGDQYETRLHDQPDDYLTLSALADLRRAQGREEESHQLRVRAGYSAPDPAAALKALADEAGDLGETEEAIAYERKLVDLPGQGTAENLERLANRQEAALDDAVAAGTWEQIAARFPRDTGALARAAGFFERTGQPERARELLVRVVSVDPGDLPRRCRLGELCREAGDVAGARGHFEQILARSEPEPAGAALRLPPELAASAIPAGGATVVFASDPPPAAPESDAARDDEAGLRLRAILALAQTLPGPREDPASRQAWLDRWKVAAAAGARSEPLRALYDAGEAAAVMDLLGGWLAERPADDMVQGAYLQAGLRLGQYKRLATWAWPERAPEESVVRGPLLVDAVEQFLQAGGQPRENMVAGLFPPEARATDLLWRAAKNGFADHHWPAQAAQLGERIAGLVTTTRAVYAAQTARWEFALGWNERARTLLASALTDGEGTSYEDAIFDVLRAYYLLLPDAERPGFVDNYLRRWRNRGEPLHALLAAVLLHGLHGDGAAARAELDQLLAMQPTDDDTEKSADLRRWKPLLINGDQLQGWNLAPLAVHLWRGALTGATAFDRQDGAAPGALQELRKRLVDLDIVTARDPQEARERVASYLRGNPHPDEIKAEADALAAASRFAAARQFYEFLTILEPESGEGWRGLLDVCSRQGDTDAVERILTSFLDGTRRPPTEWNRAEAVRQLAVVQRDTGDPAGALRLLEREFQHGTRGSPLATTLAQEYERTDHFDDALRVWQGGLAADPANAGNYRLAMARLEERRGNLPGAISLLESRDADHGATGWDDTSLRLADEVPFRLAGLYLRVGRLDDARRLARDAGQERNANALVAISRAFSRAGHDRAAREWLLPEVRRTKDPAKRFQLLQALLALNLPLSERSEEEFTCGLRHLRAIAQAAPTLQADRETACDELARQHGLDGWLEDELKKAWRDGQGSPAAGERLVHFYLDRRRTEPLPALVAGIAGKPGLSEASLCRLATRLSGSEVPVLAVPFCERLHVRFPQSVPDMLAAAWALRQSDQPTVADQWLDALDQASAPGDDHAAEVASWYDRASDFSKARAFYRRAIERDPDAVRSPAAHLGLAGMEARRGDWPAVRRLLLPVFRHPAGAELRPLAQYLCAVGRTDTDGFPLTFLAHAQLLALMHEGLESSDRPTEARALLLSRPEFLAASPDLTAAVRADQPPALLAADAALLEQALAAADPPVPRLHRELAGLYVRWADQQTNGDTHEAGGQWEHLTRANQLVPDNFEAARRLAALHLERGENEQAAGVLRPFLAADALPAEREAARRLLARH